MKQLILILAMLLPFTASADRIKDMASIQGVRDNQLIGYGLVVGLDGSATLAPEVWAMVARARETYQLQTGFAVEGVSYQVLGNRITMDREQEGIILMFVALGDRGK